MAFPHFDPDFFRAANFTVSEFEVLFARVLIAIAGLKYMYDTVFPSKKKKPPS
jgi:hypothetical protein